MNQIKIDIFIELGVKEITQENINRISPYFYPTLYLKDEFSEVKFNFTPTNLVYFQN